MLLKELADEVVLSKEPPALFETGLFSLISVTLTRSVVEAPDKADSVPIFPVKSVQLSAAGEYESDISGVSGAFGSSGVCWTLPSSPE